MANKDFLKGMAFMAGMVGVAGAVFVVAKKTMDYVKAHNCSCSEYDEFCDCGDAFASDNDIDYVDAPCHCDTIDDTCECEDDCDLDIEPQESAENDKTDDNKEENAG